MNKIKLPNHTIEFIKQLIPQREPIIMVDTIFEYEEGKVVGGLTVTVDSIFVASQELNESGLLEHMAQTVALYTGYQFYIRKETAPTGYIGSMKSIDIYRLPKVNDNLITTATILHEVMGVTLVSIETKINGEIIAKGEMKTVIAET
ncbi:hypothetical protein EB1_10920 [Empedobacter brevis NBRC 14943 = ATCC 43319]|uniref:FabZ n=1 Tax=Empedobacter brevis NBRC 14943 = ATCC 43319 TaxID=1218108 RepID=A0A511NES1_9FLAO|nr:hypothetical protein [Empedobacter brevis]GEM51302.1 hypothetical protein EB1_10920 [Empedobacter brevis NBRC 14943 = ATCC 43319]